VAEEAELTAGGGTAAEKVNEGRGSMTSTVLKRSLSGTLSDDDILTQHPSKTVRRDNELQKTERSTAGLIRSQTLNLSFSEVGAYAYMYLAYHHQRHF